MAKPVTSIVLPSAAARLDAARAALAGVRPPIVVIAATRAAADEFAFSLAHAQGATFGVTRSSLAELVARLAVPALARQGLTPSAPLSDEAVSARIAHELLTNGSLKYFAPVADMPGFPRALSRKLGELRMAAIDPSGLAGHDANEDLSALLERAIDERRRAGAVDTRQCSRPPRPSCDRMPTCSVTRRSSCSTSRLLRTPNRNSFKE